MRRAWLALALLAASTPAVAVADAGVAEIMRMLSEVPAARSRFVETRTAAMLNAPLVLTGRLSYRRPSHLERQVLTPYEERTTIDGVDVVIESGKGATRRMSVPPGPLQALLESTRATLAGDLPALERHFTVEATGPREAWRLVLVPRDPALGALVTRIEFDGAKDRVLRIEVLEPGGDRTSTIVSDDSK